MRTPSPGGGRGAETRGEQAQLVWGTGAGDSGAETVRTETRWARSPQSRVPCGGPSVPLPEFGFWTLENENFSRIWIWSNDTVTFILGASRSKCRGWTDWRRKVPEAAVTRLRLTENLLSASDTSGVRFLFHGLWRKTQDGVGDKGLHCSWRGGQQERQHRHGSPWAPAPRGVRRLARPGWTLGVHLVCIAAGES